MIRLPKLEHVAPKSIMEACSLIERHGPEARILAGGTDLLVACKLRNLRPALLIGLGDISELRGIRFHEQDGLTIGAMTTLNRVRYNTTISKHYPALAEAAAAVGAPQLQYMGTLGGNLCLNTRCIYYNQSDSWRKSRAICLKMGGDVCHVVSKGKKCYAVFSGDTAPALMALDAQVKLVSSHGERILPVGKIFTGDGREPIALKAGEVLTEIKVPAPAAKQSSAYLKYRVRGAIDFPLTGVAVRMNREEDGICTDCKIVLNAVNSTPTVALEAGALLNRRKPTVELITQASDEAMKAAHPVANASGATPTYRRKMVGILTSRALLAVTKRLDFNI